ncbi:ATP-dependent DNA helicase CHL1 [Spathaspora sp. JA1]|nr:ATP-dependent DNA helicase CHL1 [Spathaspora sp. JA1]
MPGECHRDYHHPYDPYSIQIQLMDAVYNTIENDYKIGIFESPTGTGKTLSLICSTMTWLREYKRNNTFLEVNDEDEDDDEPEWVKVAYRESIVSRTKGKIKEFEEILDKLEKDYDANKRRDLEFKPTKKRKKVKSSELSDDAIFLPGDYYSDSEEVDSKSEISHEIEQLLKQVNPTNKQVDYVNDCPTKIFYCSRTHSQLNQFAGQLRLPKFQSSFNDDIEERTKYLPLGSRKQLCINETVRAQGDINDACIDLQKQKQGCKYLPKNYLESDLIKEFSQLSVAKIRDIEDLGNLGLDLNVCPYYSVRKGVELTEIISLPYQMIFQDSTRDIMKLDVKDSIVIIDEAHNIMDVLTSLYSVSITGDTLDQVIKSLKFYLTKFIKRLNSGNRINLQKLIKVCQSLKKFITEQSTKVKPGDEINVEDIFHDSTADLVNIHKLEKFLTKSKIAYKIENYLEKVQSEAADNSSNNNHNNPVLFTVVKFLKSLTHPSNEGKFFWDITNNVTTINYMLLDPSGIFKEILNQAKCILLCGGTMEPMSDYIDYLFPSVPQEKINKFTCGHIIPQENLKVFPVVEMNGLEFEFSFNNRNNINQLNALGKFIIEICQRVPFGIVIFLPSYKYLNQVLEVWRKSPIFKSIQKLKTVFQEPSDSSKVEQILFEYSTKAETKQGAIIFSVVGGKMSEGINFSDNLARAVVMLGLPYPNAMSGEIIAKRNFIEKSVVSKPGGNINQAKEKSRNYYENLCMRAINQSIGRSIRHIKDYSIIYLVDSRFKNVRIQKKLSKWVRDRIISVNTSEVFKQTEEFFLNKGV